MKKCTLCIDRIYDEELPVAERQPACVLTCPAHARFFGDYDDPDSEVSRLARERDGKALMPELGYKPTNMYLPPRAPAQVRSHEAQPKVSLVDKVKDWVNRSVSR